MSAVTWIHIAGGAVALAAGALALAVRKGGRIHGSAGNWFFVAMLVLGITASILGPLKEKPESPIGGMIVCYFVATAWMAARRRTGVPGRFEKVACGIVLLMAAFTFAGGYQMSQLPPDPEPPGPGVVFAMATICLLAGLGDLRWILRGTITPTQRISRHLWRMCFAFFIATGSFFLGQMDVLPPALRVMPLLLVLAFLPFVLMAFWLIRVRFARTGLPRLRPAVAAKETA